MIKLVFELIGHSTYPAYTPGCCTGNALMTFHTRSQIWCRKWRSYIEHTCKNCPMANEKASFVTVIVLIDIYDVTS